MQEHTLTEPSPLSPIIASSSALKFCVQRWIGNSVISTVVSSSFVTVPTTSYLLSPVFLTVPAKPRHQGSIGTCSSLFIRRWMFATISSGLYAGTVVLQPNRLH